VPRMDLVVASPASMTSFAATQATRSSSRCSRREETMSNWASRVLNANNFSKNPDESFKVERLAERLDSEAIVLKTRGFDFWFELVGEWTSIKIKGLRRLQVFEVLEKIFRLLLSRGEHFIQKADGKN
jgi:hypothetical protein